MLGFHHEDSVCELNQRRWWRVGSSYKDRGGELSAPSLVRRNDGTTLGEERMNSSRPTCFRARLADDQHPEADESRDVRREGHRRLDPTVLTIVPNLRSRFDMPDMATGGQVAV